MGIGDKISNKAEEGWGRVKEEVGDLTGNASLEAEGQADQAAAKAKQAGEAVKDAAKDAGDAVRDVAEDVKASWNKATN